MLASLVYARSPYEYVRGMKQILYAETRTSQNNKYEKRFRSRDFSIDKRHGQ